MCYEANLIREKSRSAFWKFLRLFSKGNAYLKIRIRYYHTQNALIVKWVSKIRIKKLAKFPEMY